jgi:hypothetical protein
MNAGPEDFGAEVARGGVEFEETHPTTVLDAWFTAMIGNKGQTC